MLARYTLATYLYIRLYLIFLLDSNIEVCKQKLPLYGLIPINSILRG